MSRDGEVPFCDCGHTDRWHQDIDRRWVWCVFAGCMCSEFSEQVAEHMGAAHETTEQKESTWLR